MLFFLLSGTVIVIPKTLESALFEVILVETLAFAAVVALLPRLSGCRRA